jgi:hypothetical protein
MENATPPIMSTTIVHNTPNVIFQPFFAILQQQLIFYPTPTQDVTIQMYLM